MYVNVNIINRKLTFLYIFIIALFTAVIYSNIFDVPFFFDDVFQIEDRMKIRNISNYFSPKSLLSKRPFVELTFAVNYKFGKLNVFGYHLVNVLIHIINGILVYFLALNIFKLLMNPPAQRLGYSRSPKFKASRRLESQAGLKLGTHDIESTTSEVMPTTFQSAIINHQSSIYWMSLFTAFIFVAHPIQTQAVTYTVQRYTSLAAVFYMASILLYIKGRLWQQRTLSTFSFRLLVYFWFSFICGILAFLCKENTASLPLAVLLVEFVLFDRTWQGWKRKMIWFLPAFISLGLFILYVSGAFRGVFDFGRLLEDVSLLSKETGELGRWHYLCTQFNVIAIYVRLLFLPFGQNLDYMYPFKNGFFDDLTPLAFLFVAGMIVMGVWNFKKRPIISFGIFWFLITLSVESSIIPIRDALFEHRLYLPMLGFALVIAYLVFVSLPVKEFWRVIIGIVIVVSLGCATYLRNETYRDRVTLWSDVVSKTPENYRAGFNLGNALRDKGRLDDAIDSYSKALKIKPNYAIAHDNLGVVLMEKGEVDDAIGHFVKALETRPRGPMIHCNLGTAFMRKGKLKDAIQHFSTALRENPTLVEARNNLGIAFAQQGNLEEAIQQFSEALRIQPQNPDVHNNLGFALMLQGKTDKSIFHLSEAIRIKPDYAEAHNRLGNALMRVGNYDRAIIHFSKALEIRPDLRAARQGLERAVILNKRKRFE